MKNDERDIFKYMKAMHDNEKTIEIALSVSPWARKISKDTVNFNWDDEFMDVNIHRLRILERHLQGLLDTKGKVKLNEAYEFLGIPPEPRYESFIDKRTGENKCIGWDYSITRTIRLMIVPDKTHRFIVVDFNVMPINDTPYGI